MFEIAALILLFIVLALLAPRTINTFDRIDPRLYPYIHH